MTSLPLLAALLLSAPAAPANHPPPMAQASPGQRVEIVVRFPPWQFTGTFTLEGAGLSDKGMARDLGSLTGPEATPVERVLIGEAGTITLTLRGLSPRAAFPALFGRWKVTAGTGAYQGLAGGGSFTSTDLGSGKGSPLELQALLGRVTLPRRSAAWRGPVDPPAALRPVGPAPER